MGKTGARERTRRVSRWIERLIRTKARWRRSIRRLYRHWLLRPSTRKRSFSSPVAFHRSSVQDLTRCRTDGGRRFVVTVEFDEGETSVAL